MILFGQEIDGANPPPTITDETGSIHKLQVGERGFSYYLDTEGESEKYTQILSEQRIQQELTRQKKELDSAIRQYGALLTTKAGLQGVGMDTTEVDGQITAILTQIAALRQELGQ